MSSTRLENLRERLRGYGSCVVAYSGGVDSVFLAKVAHEVLGERSLAVIADSPSLPRAELKEALELGERFGFPVRIVQTREFNNPDYLANPVNRCYFCKHELFSELEPLAREEGFAVIAYGENASDIGDFRPGAKAAGEFQVRAPLKEEGLTKAEIRELSAALGLPTADKPQMACLSSRIPYGEAVSPLLGGASGTRPPVDRDESHAKPSLARIEVGVAELPRLMAGDLYEQVAAELKRIGYTHVTLDLEGYRRGSLNRRIGSVSKTDGSPAS
jgi:uncharacterized protein